MASLQSLRFIFITGKGGVGKTTVAAALALALAESGRRVLITQCGKERLSPFFGRAPVNNQITPLGERIWAVTLEPDVALGEYGRLMLKDHRLYQAVFDNRYVRAFFRGVPGLNEWAILGKAWFHSIELLEDGTPRFDVVLFDAPATGHGLGMLRVPKVIVEAVPPGILRRDAERAWKMFQDPRQSGVLLVTLPEDMPTNETLELGGAIRDELRLPIAGLVVNFLLEPLFSETERERLIGAHLEGTGAPGNQAILAGQRRAIRERIQSESLDRLAVLGVATQTLPLIFRDVAHPVAASRLARHLADSLHRSS